ncbi:YojF family protein [Ferroacidibacillus organovorans]|uniref:DUF1806 domain-containing protein n=1 Tax=Ferroacidibacillus organovorans TaxID=1765683 RepID=A0A162TIZ8_9BACL|nr:YojF family protein [Ferroacidibacillus organovorans]KYP80853.1 hypothetical protein AYJ22_01465 [Ferroacidibacillus organovorans]OAG95398.1 hypothetical protein AYW79_00345 [Ferroacidibacillus organovorans]OPG15765.1 hypothetical protein B2M26_09095 [Ferroacidibacillus organovorans]
MGPMDLQSVQIALDARVGRMQYVHLETTNGAYAAHREEGAMTVCAYIRNGRIEFERGTIVGDGPYRVGLKMQIGWIYAEGLTDFEVDAKGRLLMAGYDSEGRLAIALELSDEPFAM